MEKSIYGQKQTALTTRLVAARRGAGITQQMVADRLGKPQSFVAKYERGERRLDVVEFIAVAQALGISSLDILAEIIEAS